MMTPTSQDSLTLAGIFLMGLGLNLTPCVYPMLSVTVSLFGGRDRGLSRGQAFLKALIYVLGISTMYSVLGVVSALTGNLFGALLQNRLVLLAVAILFAILGMSMLGVYTFQAPAWLLGKLSARKKGNDLLGIYFSGIFVGVFAAPCVGPPVIALLAVAAAKADAAGAFWTFFVMSLGLGMPYLVLGTFSGLLKYLPRSGVWLLWTEKLFGVLLFVLSGFYLILSWDAALLKWLAPVSLLAGGLYLGFLVRETKDSIFFMRFKRVAGTIAIVIGLALPWLGPKESVVWDAYTPERFEAAQAEGRPAVLDFFADWCIPCHELDRFTYADARVVNGLQGFVRLKVDLTRPDDPATSEIVERFGILGVPSVLFVGPDGREASEARITGFVPAGEFLDILKGLPFYKKES